LLLLLLLVESETQVKGLALKKGEDKSRMGLFRKKAYQKKNWESYIALFGSVNKKRKKVMWWCH
jgi:hypothetical protein